jgi:hypothetical protein
MILTKLRSNPAIVALLLVLIAGFTLVTAFYRSLQIREPKPRAEEMLTDRHKELVRAQGDLSKWLLGLASATLAALVGAVFKEPQRKDLLDILPMTAYSLLLLSFYGAFLYYEATAQILRLGPLDYFFADQYQFPILIQFWSLISALALLAVWMLRRRAPPILASCILLLLIFPPAHAQSVSRRKCAATWFKDRLAAEDDGHLAESVLGRLQSRSGNRKIETCTEVSSILDALRFAAINAHNEDSSSGFAGYLAAIEKELNNPGLGFSAVVDSVITLMTPWDRPLGTLEVKAAKGRCHILLNGGEVGFTNWIRRLEPGDYRLRIVRENDMKVLFSSDRIRIEAGSTQSISPEDPK